VGAAVVKYIQKNNIAERAGELGEKMQNAFRERLSGLNNVIEVRGKGLMIGIELDSPCTDLVAKAMDKGLLINVTSENTIRLLPPLIISDDEADKIVDIVSGLIEEI
jgi:acetylornithine/N-succinyldiaminopimelate aminotransferase